MVHSFHWMWVVSVMLVCGSLIWVWKRFKQPSGYQMANKASVSSKGLTISTANANNQQPPPKYFLLLLVCLLMFGSNVAYDAPATLFHPLKQWFNVPATEYQYRFNLLYSVYAVPNIVLPLYAGTMIDKYGFPISLLCLLGTVTTGVLVYCIGVTQKLFMLMATGRLLLGAGSESLMIVQSGLATRYFLHSNNLSLALSLILSFTRMNTVLNYNFTPLFGEWWGVLGANWLSFGCCLVSLACGLVIIQLDKRHIIPSAPVSYSAMSPAVEQVIAASPTHTTPFSNAWTSSQQRKRPQSRNNHLSADDVQYKSSTAANESMAYSRPMQKAQSWSTILFDKAESLIPVQIRNCSSPFWYLTLALVSFSVSTIAFLPMASAYLQAKYFPDDPIQASTLVSIPDSISFVMMPVIGYFTDRMALFQQSALPGSTSLSGVEIKCQLAIWKSRQLVLSGFAIALSHWWFISSEWSPVFNLAVLGLGYAAFGSILYGLMAEIVSMDHAYYESTFYADTKLSSSAAAIISIENDNADDVMNTPPANKVTTPDSWVVYAYGVSSCLLNATFVLAPMFVAWLVASSSDTNSQSLNAEAYWGMEVFFMVFGFIGSMAAFMVEVTLKRRFMRQQSI